MHINVTLHRKTFKNPPNFGKQHTIIPHGFHEITLHGRPEISQLASPHKKRYPWPFFLQPIPNNFLIPVLHTTQPLLRLITSPFPYSNPPPSLYAFVTAHLKPRLVTLFIVITASTQTSPTSRIRPHSTNSLPPSTELASCPCRLRLSIGRADISRRVPMSDCGLALTLAGERGAVFLSHFLPTGSHIQE